MAKKTKQEQASHFADTACTEACEAAYRGCVGNCFNVLTNCLATAQSDEEKAQCRARFERCMAICKEARQICLETCD